LIKPSGLGHTLPMGATRENCQAKDEQPRRPHPYLLRQIPAAASDGGSYTLL